MIAETCPGQGGARLIADGGVQPAVETGDEPALGIGIAHDARRRLRRSARGTRATTDQYARP
jgi:hypothetical protein